jgi:hypothetical protein
VCCCAVSRRFAIVAAGTDDRRLVIADAENADALRVVDLPAVPARVAVTPAWGFLIVHAAEADARRMLLYSVNGRLIRDVEVRLQITAWSSWASPAGFDFMVCGTADGAIYAFEVFWLRLGTPLWSCGDEIVTLEYDDQHGVVVAITRGGKLYIVPFLPQVC